jgi:hypothetical protein
MTILRTLFLVLFGGGLYALHWYLQEHPPKLSSRIISVAEQPWIAIARLWGPMLWFFPGILWIRLLNVPWVWIVTISLLLPLSCFFVFYLVVQYDYTAEAKRPQLWVSASLAWVPTLFVLFLSVLNPNLLLLLLDLRFPRNPFNTDLSLFKYTLFLISVVLPPIVAMGRLAWLAPKVVPLGPEVENPKRCALSMLLSYYTSFPKKTWIVEDGKAEARINGNQFMGAGPGWLLTEPENAVILKTGFKVTRIVGPGAVLTNPGEAPYRVIDLRNQIRTTRINAITRDGIEVQAPIGSLFRINRGNREVSLGEPWPYHNYRDIFQAVYAEQVDPSGLSPLDTHMALPWEDLPLIIASHKLEQAIAFYSLDQLYGGITDEAAARTPGTPQAELLNTHRRVEAALDLPQEEDLGDPLTRTTIGKLVRRAVTQSLDPRGFDIHGGGVGNKIVPTNPQVTLQRVEEWKSRFIAKVMDWHASVQRKRFKSLDKIQQDARQQLLTSMISEISDKLEATAPEERSDFVAYHLLDSLIRIARRPDVGSMLPESAEPTLEKLYLRVMGESERQEEVL